MAAVAEMLWDRRVANGSEVLDELLSRHGRTFADEAGIRLADKPAPLFQLLVLTTLLSKNVSSQLGIRASRALTGAGLRTARAMAQASAHDRWQVLAEARYLRKEQTADRLGSLAGEVLERCRGDLRRLRDDADGDGSRVREGIQRFTGIGPVGADIFCREVQAVWPTLRPWADERVTAAARRLGLPHDPAGLARHSGTEDLSVLGAALVRSELEHDAEDIGRAAG